MNRRRLIFEMVFLAVTMFVIGLLLSPLIVNEWWPLNDENLRFMDRTVIYAQHLRHGDWLPVWAADDGYRLGSPLPIFYHKTFYYVSAGFLLSIGSVKAAVVATLAVFMLIGAYGFRLCVAKLTDRPVFIILLAQLLLLNSYSITNWWIRGAMAEMAAMMLVPWLIWWCLHLVKDKRFSFSLIAIVFLLVMSHNAVAMFGLILPAIAAVMFWFGKRPRPTRWLTVRLLISAGAVLLMLAPWLWLQSRFLDVYRPAKILESGFLASQNFLAGIHYMFYGWFNQWPMLLALWTALAAKGWRLKQLPRRLFDTVNSSVVSRFAAIAFIVYALLLTPLTQPLYRLIKPMEFIQFPYRLLVFTAPLAILIIARVILSDKRPVRRQYLLVSGWLLVTLVSTSANITAKLYFEPSQFNYYEKTAATNIGASGRLQLIGEFLPRVYAPDGSELSGSQVHYMYQSFVEDYDRFRAVSGGPCQTAEIRQPGYENLTKTLSIKCTRAAAVALPVSYNTQTVIIDQSTGHRLEYTRTHPEEPRIVIDFPDNTDTTLLVRLPTAPEMLRKML